MIVWIQKNSHKFCAMLSLVFVSILLSSCSKRDKNGSCYGTNSLNVGHLSGQSSYFVGSVDYYGEEGRGNPSSCPAHIIAHKVPALESGFVGFYFLVTVSQKCVSDMTLAFKNDSNRLVAGTLNIRSKPTSSVNSPVVWSVPFGDEQQDGPAIALADLGHVPYLRSRLSWAPDDGRLFTGHHLQATARQGLPERSVESGPASSPFSPHLLSMLNVYAFVSTDELTRTNVEGRLKEAEIDDMSETHLGVLQSIAQYTLARYGGESTDAKSNNFGVIDEQALSETLKLSDAHTVTEALVISPGGVVHEHVGSETEPTKVGFASLLGPSDKPTNKVETILYTPTNTPTGTATTTGAQYQRHQLTGSEVGALLIVDGVPLGVVEDMPKGDVAGAVIVGAGGSTVTGGGTVTLLRNAEVIAQANRNNEPVQGAPPVAAGSGGNGMGAAVVSGLFSTLPAIIGYAISVKQQDTKIKLAEMQHQTGGVGNGLAATEVEQTTAGTSASDSAQLSSQQIGQIRTGIAAEIRRSLLQNNSPGSGGPAGKGNNGC